MKLKEAMLADQYIPTRLKFISDPGHGWLRVPHKVIADVGLTKASFSTYSYVDNDYMYLEEDLDAGVFMQTFKHLNNVEPDIEWTEVRYTDIRTKLRNLGGKDQF
jgi:hypothetical protein